MYLSGPLVNRYVTTHMHHRKALIVGGTVVSAGALIVSAFLEASAPALVVTQGVAFGVGGSLSYYAVQAYLPEWFITRRGLSNGVCFAGTAAGGLLVPYTLSAMLAVMSGRKALIILVRRSRPRSG